jgi:hypothetical protein
MHVFLFLCTITAAAAAAVPQARVLVKSPKGPEVSPTDMFKYNAAFSNPLFRIKINNIQLKETAEENAKTNAEVRKDRCRVRQLLLLYTSCQSSSAGSFAGPSEAPYCWKPPDENGGGVFDLGFCSARF